MNTRGHIITDEICCSTKFLNMHQESQLLYMFLMIHANDDGIVDPFSVMRRTGVNRLSSLRELVDNGYLSTLENEDNRLFIKHFHFQQE